ncbi:MAG: DUF2812 domain-containing protein [Eubacteriales bacterium]|nr:DUF2812 domain-containing protein [Eubacteriales bacterium]
MESSQTLRIFNGFFPYDYKALEQDINDHAAKGWRLVSVGRFFLTYKRADMTGLRAHIEVFTGAYETDNEKKLASYKKSREKNGWKFVGDLDFFYIWYAPEDAPFAPPTFEQEHNLMQKMVWSRELSALGIALVMLVLGLVAILKCTYTDFLTFTGVGSLSILPLFTLPVCIIGFLLIRSVRRQSAYLKRGETLPVPTVQEAKRRYMPMYWFLFAAAAYIFLIFLFDAVFGYTSYLMTVIPLALACGAVLLLQKMAGTRTRRVLLVCVIAVCGVGMFAMQHWTPAAADAPADMTAVLTLDAVSDSPLKESYYRETVSPAVPAHFVYTETAESGATAKNEYFSVPFSPMRRLLLSKVRALMAKSADVCEGDAALWNADEVLFGSDGSVLVVRGREIFYYSATDDGGNAAVLSPITAAE